MSVCPAPKNHTNCCSIKPAKLLLFYTGEDSPVAIVLAAASGRLI